MEKEINRLFNSLNYSKNKFDYYFTAFYDFLYNMKKPENDELLFVSLEFYSSNCIKIEYELITNNKLGFLDLLRNHPAEKAFIYEGLPQGLTTMYDILDKKKTKDKNGKTLIDDLRLLRDTVVCHCDPDNYEIRETLALYETNSNAVNSVEQHYLFLKKRKEIIDKYFGLLECFVKIMNSNINSQKRSNI